MVDVVISMMYIVQVKWKLRDFQTLFFIFGRELLFHEMAYLHIGCTVCTICLLFITESMICIIYFIKIYFSKRAIRFCYYSSLDAQCKYLFSFTKAKIIEVSEPQMNLSPAFAFKLMGNVKGADQRHFLCSTLQSTKMNEPETYGASTRGHS